MNVFDGGGFDAPEVEDVDDAEFGAGSQPPLLKPPSIGGSGSSGGGNEGAEGAGGACRV